MPKDSKSRESWVAAAEAMLAKRRYSPNRRPTRSSFASAPRSRVGSRPTTGESDAGTSKEEEEAKPEPAQAKFERRRSELFAKARRAGDEKKIGDAARAAARRARSHKAAEQLSHAGYRYAELGLYPGYPQVASLLSALSVHTSSLRHAARPEPPVEQLTDVSSEPFCLKQ